MIQWSIRSTDTDRRFQNLRHLYPGMGLQLGVFPAIKITSVIRLLRMYYGLSLKIKHAWNAARHAKIVDAFCLRLFPRVWSAETWPEYPQLELHGWRRHYTGGIGVLGSPFYILVKVIQSSLHWITMKYYCRIPYENVSRTGVCNLPSVFPLRTQHTGNVEHTRIR